MKVGQIIGKVTHTLGKHAPLVLTGVGIVGLGATAYFSYKAAKKVEIILDEKEQYDETLVSLEEINQEMQRPRTHEEQLSDEEYYLLAEQQTALTEQLSVMTPMERLELVKRLSGAVALPVITGIASISCICASYYLMNNRLLNMAAALATSAAEREYLRRRTNEEFGDEGEKKIYGAPTSKETRTYTDAKGKEKEEEIEVRDDIVSLHGEWFDKSDEFAKGDHDYNLTFIQHMQSNLEGRLFTRGYLSLNEVYDALGFERSRGGAVVGWTAGDYFDIYTECPIVTDPETGIKAPAIYVKWTTPKDIYNSVEYEGRYGVFA